MKNGLLSGNLTDNLSSYIKIDSNCEVINFFNQLMHPTISHIYVLGHVNQISQSNRITDDCSRYYDVAWIEQKYIILGSMLGSSIPYRILSDSIICDVIWVRFSIDIVKYRYVQLCRLHQLINQIYYVAITDDCK